MCKKEIEIFGVEITTSLVMVKDSYKTVNIYKYPFLHRRYGNRHNKSVMNHQDYLLRCLINIYRVLQYHWLQHAVGINEK